MKSQRRGAEEQEAGTWARGPAGICLLQLVNPYFTLLICQLSDFFGSLPGDLQFSGVHSVCLLSPVQPSSGEKETREGWVKIDTIAADKSFSKVEQSSPHQYQPNRYSRVNIKTRSFAPLTRAG